MQNLQNVIIDCLGKAMSIWYTYLQFVVHIFNDTPNTESKCVLLLSFRCNNNTVHGDNKGQDSNIYFSLGTLGNWKTSNFHVISNMEAETERNNTKYGFCDPECVFL